MTTSLVHSKIMLAISFDKRVEGLIKTTIDLFYNTNVEITLAHVVQSDELGAVSGFLERESKALHKSIEEAQMATAKVRLERLAATMHRSVEVNTVVLTGKVADALTSYARAHEFDLIVLGTTKKKRLTTAVNLIAKEQVPILIIHEDSHLIDFTNEHRLLVGDDLLPGGAAAMAWGYKLFAMLPSCRILHSHIINSEELQARIGVINPQENLTEDEARAALARICNTVHDKLGLRYSKVSGNPEPQIADEYEAEVVIGDTVRELERSAIAFRADISIFSLHKIYHRELMTGGLVSFNSMINNDRLVMVVPPN